MRGPKKESPRTAGCGSRADSGSERLNHTPAERFLERLERVRQTGPDTWTASCSTPAHRHGDRNPSLCVRRGEDGRVLIWCGAGCSAADIAASVGLEMADLFPHPDAPCKVRLPRIPWRDVIEAVITDLTACSMAFSDLASGKAFSAVDAAYIARASNDLAERLRGVRHV